MVDESQTPATPPPPSRWQFGIASMLLTMGLVSVLATAYSGMLDPSAHAFPRAFFVVLLVAAPLAVMIGYSVYLALRDWLTRRR